MATICIIGASRSWTPGLVSDLMHVFGEPLEVRLLDLDPAAAKLCAEWGEAATAHHGRKDRFIPLTDRKEALKGADAVLITLSTGGLDAMTPDIAIPEKYGIFSTVGDTAGPGGWSRSIRNIPVFRSFAEDFQAICPDAFIANYTNPMSSLTATLQLCCGNPSVGLCHAYFAMKDLIQNIFGLPDWNDISISIAGMNHFTWTIDFRIGREDGYTLLREKVGSGSLRDVLPKESSDEIGFFSTHNLCVELYDAYGFLPYPADRHTCEFVSYAICGCPGHPARQSQTFRQGDMDVTADVFEYCDIKRTPMDYRRTSMGQRDDRVRDMITGKVEMPKKSRETGSEMIAAYLYNKPFTDAVNCLNEGQIDGLPLGACVETLGTVDGLGVHPHSVDGIPDTLLELIRPQAVCTQWIVEGVLTGDRGLLLHALYRDPLCAHLKPHEVRAMADELFEANKEFVSI